MRGLWLGILLLSLPFAAFAASDRDKVLRQYFDGSADSRGGGIGTATAAPCNCSDGQALDGTAGLIFNCICGTMQCVVVGVGAAAQNNEGTPNLVCR
jgi:hypothetical protein